MALEGRYTVLYSSAASEAAPFRAAPAGAGSAGKRSPLPPSMCQTSLPLHQIPPGTVGQTSQNSQPPLLHLAALYLLGSS